MKYSLTLREEEFEQLRSFVFSKQELEGAAYLLCTVSQTDDELRFLGREVIAVENDQYLKREPFVLSISSYSFTRVAKYARRNNLSVLFVHSHPGGLLEYSQQDDEEEPKLQNFLASRIPERVHGSLLLTETGIIGRVNIGGFQPMSRIRVIGSRFRFFDNQQGGYKHALFYDRQVRAFGPDTQSLLEHLHIGIVGAGGTGSAIIEQLTRLGIGTLSVFDGDHFDESNVNRIYGSCTQDSGVLKVNIAKRNVDRIGLTTVVECHPQHITNENIAKELRRCDLIFGCTDKQQPRSILVQLALRYLIPVIDMGVVIDSDKGAIRDVVGRVTTLIAGEACLFCRKRITPEGIQIESLSKEERARLAKEGYAPELEAPAPSVVPFTSTIASFAISEMLHRLTGYMGEDRHSTELLCFFDQNRLRTNRPQPGVNCLCSQRSIWGRGDTIPFLNTSWAN